MFKSLPLAAAAILLGQAASADVMATATTDLNIRSGPGPQFDVVGVISANEPATISGCIEGSQWCSVAAAGLQGWAFAQYLSATDAGGAAVIVGDQIATLGLPALADTASVASAAAPGAAASAPAVVPQDASGEITATAIADLNLRSGPGTGFDVIAVINADDPATVSGCLEDSLWCSVEVAGLQGWAYAQYLSTTDASGMPVIVGDQIAALGLPAVAFTASAAPAARASAPSAAAPVPSVDVPDTTAPSGASSGY